MRAVWLKQFGDPSVLVPGEAPDPVPGPGQVLVDVAYANITFVETQFRATGLGPFRAEPPLIPGNGVGGTVSALGPDVDPQLLGRRVVTGTGGSGGYAERVAVPAEGLFAVPDGLALDDAVALLADGRTAVMQLRAAEVKAGDRVLVEAAAGGVGSLLVQLAKAAGAQVVAVAGGERKLALARELGADLAFDYREDAWAQLVHQEVGPLDVVFDGVGGAVGRAAFELLAPGGRMDSYGLASGEWAAIPDSLAAAREVRLVSADRSPEHLRACTEHALAEAAAGRLRPVIGQRFPLELAADAHVAIESRATLGKTLLETAS
ncbi:zinc-binding dehydrogenase [Kitasatospora kifunensis]|uniref:NADPH2:quinone reductase n=1 Tax=Kitasatospora kifunensis TaxID=58351 RepID=A0A7W7R0D6_KITKI|nr:zinc-binding dehydrogenase [Kitasatospora kifunensis]MBB4923049.1 NADPH2:quinone reductase [Kitasatospora kifunensis]